MKFKVIEETRPTSNFQLPTSNCFLLFLALGFFLFSCKSSKEITKSSSKKFDADSILVELEKSSIQFEWLYAKARVNYEDKSQTKSFSANIRMRKDSIVWISITTIMGVEAARLLIHDDTVFLIDKLNKKYQTESFSYLENYFPFPFNITLLQKILVGNAILFESGNPGIKKEKGGFLVSSEDSLYRHTINLNGDDLTISTEHLIDRQNDRKLSLVFGDYKNDAGRLFSYSRNMSFSGDEKITLSLKFSKVKWDEPQIFPFHVDDRYED